MIAMDKKDCRKFIRDRKTRYTLEQRRELSVEIWRKIERNVHFQEARSVLAYWSIDDEVYTHDFIRKWAKEKMIFLPCVRGDELEVFYYEGEEGMRPGESFGILEPTGMRCDALDVIDLILVPGMAFDRSGNRLGRGKGYYDKILKKTFAWKIGVCFDFQVLEEVPSEAHDVVMDEVIF